MTKTEIQSVYDCDLGLQVVVRHGWYGAVPGIITFDDPKNLPPRVRAVAAWTLQRLRESGRDVSDLILGDVRVQYAETQLSFRRTKP